MIMEPSEREAATMFLFPSVDENDTDVSYTPCICVPLMERTPMLSDHVYNTFPKPTARLSELAEQASTEQ